MEVSVIIPIYNTDKYLRRCIDSVINQDFEDYEILLIDDGSTDNCGMICDEYKNKSEKVFVIHKPHCGVSSACNCGIEHSNGKYLMFCDSDDYVEPDWISTLYRAIEDNPDDFVFCAFFKEDTSKSRLIHLSHGDYYSRYSISDYYLMYQKGFSAYRWIRIFRKDKISDTIRFNESISVGEDVLFNIEYLKTCNSFLYVDKPLYHWGNDRSDSLSRAYHAKYYNDIKNLYFPRASVIADKDMQNYYNEYFHRFYACIDIVNDNRNTMSKSEKKAYINYILHDEAFCHALKHSEKSKLKTLVNFKSYSLIMMYKKLCKIRKIK